MGTKLAKKGGVKPKRAIPASDRAQAKVVGKKSAVKVTKKKEEELKLPSESEESESESEQEKEQSESDEEEEEEQLGGFESTDDEESDDDEDDEDDEDETDEIDDKKEQKTQSKTKTENTCGVIYIGRLPEEFQEVRKVGDLNIMPLLNLQNGDDAKIAQETMNNYLLLNHQLKVNIVDEEFKSLKKFKRAFFKVSKPKKDVKTLNENSKKKSQDRLTALKAAGIDF
ncbi:Ribosome biogenesis protein 15 [Cyberlindnera fabianii]|uniref:Ribosome biogenesis protein 15 n=1 Tax=Cyberlindnera fabianii TaxID=36022 RepID=A0A1V2LBP1_CYBFA|nr:Ribosome biogenesis protein 15 [Cyberlindnera fabianii]